MHVAVYKLEMRFPICTSRSRIPTSFGSRLTTLAGSSSGTRYIIVDRVPEWLVWFTGCLERAVERSQGRVGLAVEKARFWQGHSSVGLIERQRKIVNRMLDAGRGGFVGGMTTHKYLGLAHCSRATAQREIADLVGKGLFVRRPGGGRSTSFDLV